MTTKEVLQQRVDALPDGSLEAAREVLEPLPEPMQLALAELPPDDEDPSSEEDAMAAESWAAYRRGEYLIDAQLDARLGKDGP
jgi:hypothetical protein